MPVNLAPATTRMADLVRGVPDDALGNPTPSDISLGALLDHVRTLTLAFTAAAQRDFSTFGGPPPKPDAANLDGDWRERICASLDGLAAAWSEPEAWTGMTKAGGLDLPGEVAGVVALDEIVVHGWDVARSTGQPYAVDPDLLETVHAFVIPFADPDSPMPREGLFGPPVPVPADAPLLDRVIGLTGRDPAWSPR
jgi:uncharacterized protein (TIGR03086 family)